MSKVKKALLTGITGQDGSYLAEFLLSKDYVVHGLIRWTSNESYNRILHLQKSYKKNLILIKGDLVDCARIYSILSEYGPYDEIYNLGAVSHVGDSFEMPEYVANVNALGCLRILEAIRKLSPTTRFYQASSSELFGKVQQVPQTELTPFYPRSPYAVSKLFAYWTTVNYREAYGLYACNGLLFNHESPRRGVKFVTQKIVSGFKDFLNGKLNVLFLGNLNALRDWGHAIDYVKTQWLILQQSSPDDYVIASGTQVSVRQFAEKVAIALGLELSWEGKGMDEQGVIVKAENENLWAIGKTIIKVCPSLYRPTEVASLLGDATKAKNQLGWEPEYNLDTLIKDMIQNSDKNCIK